MNSLLAFPIYLHKPEPGKIQHAMDTAAMDWFVIATLCFFFFLLGCFATAAWQIWRRTTRPEPHVQLLIELAESDEDGVIRSAEDNKADQTAPWEKTPDWWKT